MSSCTLGTLHGSRSRWDAGREDAGGEDANRATAGAKRQRYSEARGEIGEVAANAQLLTALDLAPDTKCDQLIHLSGRVAAMLTRPIVSVR